MAADLPGSEASPAEAECLVVAVARPPIPRMSTDLSSFPNVLETFPTKAAAYQKLGIGTQASGHKLMLHNSKTGFSTLYCKQWQQGCPFQGALVYLRNGKAELRVAGDQSGTHDYSVEQVAGKRGSLSLAQKNELTKRLTSDAFLQPRQIHNRFLTS
jgi:hypothetical protein